VRRVLKPRTASAGPDSGFSLTELLVTMFVMGIVVAATVSLTIGFQRTNASNVSRQDQIDSARTAVEAISKSVRTAIKPAQLTSTCTSCIEDAFLQGTDYSVQFYANLNNPGNTVGPSRVTYTLVTTGPKAGQIVETIQRPDSLVIVGTGYAYCDATAGSASAKCKAQLSTRPVAFGALATTGTPMLKYYDSAGNQLSPATSGGSLSVKQLGLVLSIEIVVTVQTNNATKASPTTYVQRVTLPNAQAVIREGEG
jgi:prepilin-type N-terminal cleavage/methylation domain-containing protein